MTARAPAAPDYGIDAAYVLRNLLLSGAACLLLAQGLLYLWYVKAGKFHHRDYLLSLHHWSGGEQLLDVGCGRGLLLAAAMKRIAALGGDGHGTGVDIWSIQDVGGNSGAATRRNLYWRASAIAARCWQ